jgi:hypothetical protein
MWHKSNCHPETLPFHHALQDSSLCLEFPVTSSITSLIQGALTESNLAQIPRTSTTHSTVSNIIQDLIIRVDGRHSSIKTMLRLTHSDRNLKIFHLRLINKLSVLLSLSVLVSERRVRTHISNSPVQIILQPFPDTRLRKIIQTNPILPLLLLSDPLDQVICQYDLTGRQDLVVARGFFLFATGCTAFDACAAGFNRGGEVVDDSYLTWVG